MEMETIWPIYPLVQDNKEKHDVSTKTLDTLRKVMFSQDDYGFEKYHKPLKHTYRYDWLQMFLEEMADGLKYIQNEMDRKAFVIQLLEEALESDTPRDIIRQALEILTIKGTGK